MTLTREDIIEYWDEQQRAVEKFLETADYEDLMVRYRIEKKFVQEHRDRMLSMFTPPVVVCSYKYCSNELTYAACLSKYTDGGYCSNRCADKADLVVLTTEVEDDYANE